MAQYISKTRPLRKWCGEKKRDLPFDGMKSSGRASHIAPSSGRNYAGRRTLERIYRRIASSNVVGTLTRVSRRAAHRSGHRHRTSSSSHHHSHARSTTSALHPQGSVLQKRNHQLNQLRLERAKLRRKAREQRLKKVSKKTKLKWWKPLDWRKHLNAVLAAYFDRLQVWEEDVLSSGSEEVIHDGCTTIQAHPTVRLVRSLADDVDDHHHHHRHSLPCSDESSSTSVTDVASSLQYLAGIHRSKKKKSAVGCASPGYIPQVRVSRRVPIDILLTM